MAHAATEHKNATFHVWRGEAGKGEMKEYTVPVESGMVVLDAMPRAMQPPRDVCPRIASVSGCSSITILVNHYTSH